MNITNFFRKDQLSIKKENKIYIKALILIKKLIEMIVVYKDGNLKNLNNRF